MLVDAGSELAMLRNVETNQPIEGFPQTPRNISGLTGRLLVRPYARLEQTIEVESTQGGKGLECKLA
ncbi:hypothetical protein V493_06158 [Pseudogymnoascus sp. VKM F-4281 (FW-2241)]|nr:hypothetical protein V493_06158 [Pseudogymnoascus sp. VKM F-4281 (FW-2241)]